MTVIAPLSLRDRWRTFRRGCIGTLAGAAAVAGFARPAAAQVSVEQLELFFRLRPAETRLAAQTFRVNNNGSAPAQVTVTAQDWDRTIDGENHYHALGTLAGSCGRRIQVFPSVLQLDAHASQDVRVTVDSAAALPNGCQTILFVETPQARPQSMGTALVYTLRYGIKVYVEPDGPATLDLVDAQLAAADSGARTMLLTTRNTGVRQAIASGTLEVRRADDTIAATVPIAEFPVLPGASRLVRVPVPKLPRGQYVLLATLDFGGAELVAAQAELVVP